MNTLCLVTSRLSFVGAVLSLVAMLVTGNIFFLGLLFMLNTLSLVFHIAYGNFHSALRTLDEKETEVTGLADLLEPDDER